MIDRAAKIITTATRVARSEGLRAAADRIRDRFDERKRLQKFAPITAARAREFFGETPPPVLNLSPIPPSPKRGGSQIQMLDRLEEEGRLRPLAVAYRDGSTLHVELRAEDRAGRLSLEIETDLATVVRRLARDLGIEIVHIENLHGFSPGLVDGLDDAGLAVVISVHDFTLFCRRPHLIETTSGRFCEYSTDPGRCSACLRHDLDQTPASQEEYRRQSRAALHRTRAVVYPSHFLQSKHHELFIELSSTTTEAVIPPATAVTPTTAVSTADRPNVAFVGGFAHHKGGALIPPAVARVAAVNPTVRFFVYGNGDAHLSSNIRAAGRVRIRGYYQPGILPRLLNRDRVGVAVLPSIWPEAYGLVVDECVAAGVPVVAFDLGAVGERISRWHVGSVTAPRDGAEGLALGIIEQMNNPSRVAADAIDRIPRPRDPAVQHIALYRRLLGHPS